MVCQKVQDLWPPRRRRCCCHYLLSRPLDRTPNYSLYRVAAMTDDFLAISSSSQDFGGGALPVRGSGTDIADRPIRKLLDGLIVLLDESPAHERAMALHVFSRADPKDLPASLPRPVEAASISSIRVNFSLGLPFGLPREIS